MSETVEQPGADSRTVGACGDGSGECADVMRDVWRFLDDELDPERRAAVQRHLDGCSPCLVEAGVDMKLKALLARKCGGDQAPAHLRERIVSKMVQWRSAAGSDDAAHDVEVTHNVVDIQWGEPG